MESTQTPCRRGGWRIWWGGGANKSPELDQASLSVLSSALPAFYFHFHADVLQLLEVRIFFARTILQGWGGVVFLKGR